MTLTFNVAFELLKEFDKTTKNVEAIADDDCKIVTQVCGVSEGLDKLRRDQEENNTNISDISKDLAEVVIFVDDVATQFNLHGNGPLPKMRGKMKIKIKR